MPEQYKNFEAGSRKKVIDDAGADFDKALNGMIEWFEDYDQDIFHVILYLELQTHAMRHPSFLDIYNKLMDEQKVFYGSLVEQLYKMKD